MTGPTRDRPDPPIASPAADDADAGGPTDAPPTFPAPRFSWWRTTFYAVSLVIILVAGAVVPLPLVETVPGNTSDIPPLIEIDGIDVDDLTGSTALLTIQRRERPPFSVLAALLDPDRSLQPIDEVYPPDIDRDRLRELQREQFSRQFELAAAVGARAAGVTVEVITRVVVINILPDSPADGLLEPGDVVLSAGGRPLEGAEELQTITAGYAPGDELTLTISRDGRQRREVAELAAAPDGEGARLGVAIETAVDELQLPFDIALAPDIRIGGPSAGLMIGVTVYDLLADEDLLQGRRVVGTGTLSAGGVIGPVGGVAAKMTAAAETGADLVLVPGSQVDLARQAAPDGLTVVGVGTLEEAIEALRRRPA